MPDHAVPPTPPVPLAALLAREDLGLRQIAGPVDADTVIHWAHTSEMADPYPYLLGGLRVERPNQVWCADITYLPMRRGFLYLVAIMDWSTRKVLAWRISNTLEADFCVAALNEAIHRFGPPDIMNTDQGSQFTSFAWTDRLKRVGTRISMDGKGRCLDNIFIERLWRSLKYECVYLHAWETGSQAKAGIGRWITFYNHQRPHAAHGGQPPAVVYFSSIETDQQARRVA